MSEPIITKQCSCCKQIKPIDEFYKESVNKDGHNRWCKECSHKYRISDKCRKYDENYRQTENCHIAQKKYNQSKKGKINNRYMRMRYYYSTIERQRAKSKIRYAIKKGIIQKASNYKCSNCDNQASDYHHWSYEREHWFDVIPLCRKCHRQLHTHHSVLKKETNLFPNSKTYASDTLN